MPHVAAILIPPKSQTSSIVPALAKRRKDGAPAWQKKVGILRLRNAIQKTNRVPALRKTIWCCRMKMTDKCRHWACWKRMNLRGWLRIESFGPQWLKPRSLGNTYGTAEAVPFPFQASRVPRVLSPESRVPSPEKNLELRREFAVCLSAMPSSDFDPVEGEVRCHIGLGKSEPSLVG